MGGERSDTANWRALVAELVIELRWTREAVLDQIDMPFLRDLRRAWAECPPPRRLLAAYLGYQPPSQPSNDYHELLAMFPHGNIK